MNQIAIISVEYDNLLVPIGLNYIPGTPMFTARKAAQMAAFFANQQGGTINILKLMKLLYLADRESMKRFAAPISYDLFGSMDQGPVLSRTLNLINGTYPSLIAADWEEWINDKENYELGCNREFERKDLDCLSDADMEVLESVWADFGHMNQWQLRDYSHTQLPAWTDPCGAFIAISAEQIVRGLGIDEAEELAQEVDAEYELDRLFARL